VRSLVVACALFGCTLAVGCSTDHTGISTTPPFDPIGSEPTSADAGVGIGLLARLCEQACAHQDAACPGLPSARYCRLQCNAQLPTYASCDAEQVAYTVCLATTTYDCSFGFPRAVECDDEVQAINDCIIRPPGTPGPL
jgi:hypothetical protein